ncbi:TIGR02450 family Trp-rich protein [Polynucleobacter kasalickyi]|uniref:TIGR02450 family Trp-rich protein n=1 Tax=Polynucleobacter kasalickyi TaxID=1938817 RepID=A0A1W2C8N3_9BURK|nr:TIGR02450 family Trp-rich protein [Polynucleobacter kasalickyi]SMC81344.1 tryptophan-rich conserved hypothetical protein [Polynucleobacter kasalickyi]
MNRLSPKKLLLTKWTAVQPLAKNKHFIVTKVIQPEDDSNIIDLIEIEAVYSKKILQISWRDLQDDTKWLQGWK